MSPTSYQLLHSAMLLFDFGCKGTGSFPKKQMFVLFFFRLKQVLTCKVLIYITLSMC